MSCPFYGCSLRFDTLVRFGPKPSNVPSRRIGVTSNQCALITSAHSPCWMEVAENAPPDWAQCPRNPEFVTEVIRGLPAEQRFNAHVHYMDELRVQAGIAAAGFKPRGV